PAPEPAKQRGCRRSHRPLSGPAMPSRYQLYEAAVQQPVLMVGFIEHMYAELARALPTTLREDFCGTANLASTWVAGSPSRRAIAVDCSSQTLHYAERRNRRPLGAAAARLR